MEQKNIWAGFSSKYGKILLILSLSIAFLDIRHLFTYGIMAVWIALAVSKFALGFSAVRELPYAGHVISFYNKLGFYSGKKQHRERILIPFLQYNLGSKIAIYVYTLILILFGLTERRFFSSNVMTFLNGLSAASIFYLFGSKSVIYSTVAACFSWVWAVFGVVLEHGFVDFLKHLEFHDLSFGVGYVLLYFLCLPRKWKLRDYILCAMVLLIILCAFKRIGLAALAVAWLVWLVLRYLGNNEKRTKVIEIGSICAIVVCYLFVLMIIQGWMVAIADALGVNVMGRNYYYEALASHCKFVPWFLGLGRNASATLFATDYAFMNVGNVHSDILRMYAECGFIGFGLWLAVYWWFLPKALNKKFGYRAMEFFVICTVYTFIVYTTDNTELYLVNQYFYMLMPMACAALCRPRELPQ